MDANRNQLKQLDLLGGLGAGVLGAGLALLFAKWLQPFALPALIVGVFAHGWAMFAKSRLEQRLKIEQPKWAIAAEWVCWIMLVSLILYVGAAILR